MKFYTTERIGPKRSKTPEGFMLCHDVPIARIGIMDYLEDELPGVKGDRGVIRVQRQEDDVFKPEAIASFAGKPVVNDHPDEDVTPLNWRELAVGTTLNPRRGEGNYADVLIADLLITDHSAIEAIEDGKVEVSCGYDAEYEQLRPGHARQHEIIGNHVALVEQGRCGPRCSIGDHAMSITLSKSKEADMAKIVKKSFKDRLMAAFKAKDEAAIEKLAEEGSEAMKDEDIAESDVTGTGQHIHVHVNSGSSEKPTTDESEEEGEKKDPLKEIASSIDGLANMVKDCMERVGKLEAGGSATSDEDTDEDEDEDESESTADSDEEEEDDKDKKKTGDKKTVTRDSKGLDTVFQDTVARAEILSPGIKVPTFDAKADRKKTRDMLCAFRRKALDKAYTTDEGKVAIDALLAGGKFDTKKLTCDATKVMFNAASENMKSINRAGQTGSGRIRANDTGVVKAPTIAEMNKGFSDFWKRP